MRNAKRILLIGAMICAIVPTVCLAADKTRVLHFPKGRSLGELSIQDVGAPRYVDVHLRFPVSHGWEYFGEATGDVTVPAGKRLRLYVNEAGLKSLYPFSQLGANDLYMLTLPKEADDAFMPHVAQLQGLKVLCLGSTNITDKGLRSIEEMDSLEILSLPPQINNRGLAHLKRLKSLETLYLSGHKITDIGLSKLIEAIPLKDVYCRFHRKANLACLSKIAKLPSLRYHIQFNRVDFSNLAMKQLANATSLITLNLPGSPVSETALSYLSNLNKLESLSLFDTPVTDNGLAYLKSLQSLKKLNIREYAGNKTNVTDSGMVHIGQIKSLEYLEFPSNITDEGLAHLTGLKNLTTLISQNNRNIGDQGLKHISRLSNLKQLRLHSRDLPVTDEGLEYLAKLNRLEELCLGGKGITNNGMSHIAKLTNLQDLELGCSKTNPIDNAGLAKLTTLRSLRKLRLASPKITTSGLTCLNRLRELTCLVVSIAQDNTGLDISGLSRLEKLHMTTPPRSETIIRDEDLVCLTKLTNLKELFLARHHPDYKFAISDKGMFYLKDLVNLELLWIGGPKMTDKGLSYVANMKKMNNLNITGDFTDQGLRCLEKLTKIKRLRITSRNAFTPSAVKRLRNKLPRANTFEVEPQKQMKTQLKQNELRR